MLEFRIFPNHLCKYAMRRKLPDFKLYITPTFEIGPTYSNLRSSIAIPCSRYRNVRFPENVNCEEAALEAQIKPCTSSVGVDVIFLCSFYAVVIVIDATPSNPNTLGFNLVSDYPVS